MVVSLMLFMRWVKIGASSWLPVAVRQQSPRLSYVIGLLISGVILAIWYGVLFLGRDVGVTFLVRLGESASFLGLAGLFLIIPVVIWINLHHPVLFASLVCLWAFPLAARLSWKATASIPVAGWVYLDRPSPKGVSIPQAIAPKIRSVLRPAIIGGTVFCVLWLLLRLGVRAGVSELTRDSDQFKITLFLVGVLLAAFIQVAVGALVAGRVRRGASLYGLLAAFVAGSVMGLGFISINAAFGGTFKLDTLWFNYAQIVDAGALLTLPTAIIVSAVAGWFRR